MEQRFSAFLRAVVDGNVGVVARLLTANPEFAAQPCGIGATRGDATTFFYKEIAHCRYQGDTALHMAAAAFQRTIARLLVDQGAALDARNRRAAEPLHYAADANWWNPPAQSETIEYLLSVGASPDPQDANGATPLHRAVRTRSAAAVRALLAGGADVSVMNRNGSTPLDVAMRATGRGGAGSTRAREQQTEIIAMLREAGAGAGAGPSNPARAKRHR